MMWRSLRLRLLFGAAVAVFAALAAAWFAMTWLFERHLEHRVEAELTREGLQLIAGLTVDADGVPRIDPPPPDPRFAEPASGVYWQVSTTSGSERSRSLWDAVLPSTRSTSQEWSLSTTEGPFGPRVLVLERTVTLDRGGPPIHIQLAQDRRSLMTARAEFGTELAYFLAFLWLILSAAAWLQVELGLRPLREVRAQVDRLRANPAQRLSTAPVREIEPLTEAINALADAREADLTRARRRAADLAHGLKTPLAALSAQSRRAREAGATEAADGLDYAIAAAASAVEAELTRTRAAALQIAPLRGEASPKEIAERLVAVVERTEFGGALVFDVDLPSDMRVPLAEDDLTELMGALIENAARFARRRVRISGEHTARLELYVDDDGPGMEEDQLSRANSAGARVDEAGAKQGRGLAIARELAEGAGASLLLQRSAWNGLRASVAWPWPSPRVRSLLS